MIKFQIFWAKAATQTAKSMGRSALFLLKTYSWMVRDGDKYSHIPNIALLVAISRQVSHIIPSYGNAKLNKKRHRMLTIKLLVCTGSSIKYYLYIGVEVG